MITIKNGKVFMGGSLVNADIYIENDKITKIAPGLEEKGDVIDASGKIVSHGFVDMHVHLREPGFEHKETIKTGTAAAAKGGFTTICPMPNLNPVPDTVANVQYQLDLIEKDACVNVFPFAAITMGEKGQEIVNMIDIAPYVVGFSDDGKGIQTAEMMDKVMMTAAEIDMLVSAHCEDEALLNGGYIHEGKYSQANGHKGIVSECEYGQVVRDIALAEKYGARYHVCHISAKESVDIIRQAKKSGVDITCETAPHYLVLDENDLREEGRFKMNPPLRGAEDKQALIEGILDGTIDMIATDHAPHSAEEKGKGLEKSAFGIVGLETAFPVMYTHFVKTGILSLHRLTQLMCINPRMRFAIPLGEDFTVWELDKEITVNPENFASMGKATPFAGEKLFGECVATVCGGKLVYKR